MNFLKKKKTAVDSKKIRPIVLGLFTLFRLLQSVLRCFFLFCLDRLDGFWLFWRVLELFAFFKLYFGTSCFLVRFRFFIISRDEIVSIRVLYSSVITCLLTVLFYFLLKKNGFTLFGIFFKKFRLEWFCFKWFRLLIRRGVSDHFRLFSVVPNFSCLVDFCRSQVELVFWRWIRLLRAFSGCLRWIENVQHVLSFWVVSRLFWVWQNFHCSLRSKCDSNYFRVVLFCSKLLKFLGLFTLRKFIEVA